MGTYDDLKYQDLGRALASLREAEQICNYWKLVGTERGIARMRGQIQRSRNRAARNLVSTEGAES